MFFLSRRAQKTQRRKSVLSYSKVGHCTLLYEVNGSEIPMPIRDLKNTFMQEGKTVNEVIYYTGDPKQLKINNEIGYLVFTNRDLDVFYRPKRRIIEIFNSLKTEYLIDLNLTDSFPLTYLAGISGANLRSGKESALRMPYYDFLIQEKKADLQEFIRHLVKYLKIINPHDHD